MDLYVYVYVYAVCVCVCVCVRVRRTGANGDDHLSTRHELLHQCGRQRGRRRPDVDDIKRGVLRRPLEAVSHAQYHVALL
jgi:hypothetical protein